MIESLANQKIKYAVKLTQKKYRQLHNEFLVEGYHLLEEALKTGMVKTVFTIKDESFEEVETIQVSEQVMQKISELNERNSVVAICSMKVPRELNDDILILDQIQDPGNMGTLIRTAAAFGFNTIIADQSVDYYNEKVIRASQGAVFHVDLLEKDIISFINKHPEYHYYGTDVMNGIDVRELVFSREKRAIILGNEGSGVRSEIRSLVNTNILIPMLHTESLNVGIAGGILMFEAFRRK